MEICSTSSNCICDSQPYLLPPFCGLSFDQCLVSIYRVPGFGRDAPG